ESSKIPFGISSPRMLEPILLISCSQEAKAIIVNNKIPAVRNKFLITIFNFVGEFILKLRRGKSLNMPRKNLLFYEILTQASKAYRYILQVPWAIHPILK